MRSSALGGGRTPHRPVVSRTSVLSVHRTMEKSVPLAWPCHTQMATPDDSTTSDATTLLVGTWPSMK